MDAATTNTLIATAVPFFGTVLTGLVGVGVALAYKKLGLQQTATAAVVEHNAHAAIQGALVTGAGIYATQGKAAAVNYVAAVVPDAIEHFGLTSVDVSTAIIGRAAAFAGVTAPAGLVIAQPPPLEHSPCALLTSMLSPSSPTRSGGSPASGSPGGLSSTCSTVVCRSLWSNAPTATGPTSWPT